MEVTSPKQFRKAAEQTPRGARFGGDPPAVGALLSGITAPHLRSMVLLLETCVYFFICVYSLHFSLVFISNFIPMWLENRYFSITMSFALVSCVPF